MSLTLIISLVVLVFGFIGLLFIITRKKNLGILNERRVYSDSDDTEPLYSRNIPLVGKPDYIIKKSGTLMPVEIKSGKTPKEPHVNHTMQLMAYCYLIEENYGVRPPGGYIKYPEREFKVRYTDEARTGVEAVVWEIIDKKMSREEQHCSHKFH